MMFLLHYAVDLAGAIAINLVDHVVVLSAIVVLSELHSHAVEVAGGELLA